MDYRTFPGTVPAEKTTPDLLRTASFQHAQKTLANNYDHSRDRPDLKHVPRIVERLCFHGSAASDGAEISGVGILGRDRMVCGLSVGLKGGRRGQGIYGLSAGVWRWLDGVEEECGTAGASGATGSLLVEGEVGRGRHVILIFEVVLLVR
uniref:Uncharacterized protein n=1 Tax=Populus alba TaxID=43335 RepID=A0A4U5PWW8_POPAL|nr:hypothetical protein D5086_0000186330 [Populus alba]